MKISTTLLRNNVMVRVAFTSNIRKHFNTGVSVADRSQFDSGAIVNREDAAELNAKIGAKLAEVKRAIDLLEAQGIDVTPDTLSNALDKRCDIGSFLDFMERRINERPLRENSRRNHLIALAALRRFGRIQSFASLTPENIMLFDSFLREEDATRKQSTIRGYHKSIKPYIREALLSRYIRVNPYDHFYVPRGAATPRTPLSESELQRIINARLPYIYTKARDIFIFQAYTGLSYADAMAFDAREHLVVRDGHSFISHERIKTGTKFFTPLLPNADAVLLKYGDRLPRLSNQKYNMHLHAIEGIVGIDKPLTSHVARHTFATLMLSYDMPMAVVSRMLGHTDINVTQLYAKITSDKVESATSKLWGELE